MEPEVDADADAEENYTDYSCSIDPLQKASLQPLDKDKPNSTRNVPKTQ